MYAEARRFVGWWPLVFLLGAGATVLWSGGCSTEEDTRLEMSEAESTRDEIGLVTGANNRFGLNLYAQLRERESGNLFFSPFSISTALAMTCEGARGETLAELRRALCLQTPQNRVGPAFGEIITSLEDGSHGGYELDVANRLWGQATQGFEPRFLEATRDYFGAELGTVDFRRADEACSTINRWIAEQTHDKLGPVIHPGQIAADTKLVLTSAIYFFGNWAAEFDQYATRPAPFHAPGGDVEVPLMQRRDEFLYMENDDLQVLQLPYHGHDLSMLVLLPKRVDGLAEVEATLTPENLHAWIGELKEQEVDVSLPRFQLRSEISLTQTLAALGLKLPFDSALADFSGMAAAGGGKKGNGEAQAQGRPALWFSDVIHQALVDVNERGTEAAAVTGVVMRPTAMRAVDPTPVFRADHPFVFLIYDHRYDNLLFVGRLVEPPGGGRLAAGAAPLRR